MIQIYGLGRSTFISTEFYNTECICKLEPLLVNNKG